MKRNKVKQEMAKTVARGLDMVLTAQGSFRCLQFLQSAKGTFTVV